MVTLNIVNCCYLCAYSPFKSRKGILKQEAVCDFLTQYNDKDVTVSPFSCCKNWRVNVDRFNHERTIILANK